MYFENNGYQTRAQYTNYSSLGSTMTFLLSCDSTSTNLFKISFKGHVEACAYKNNNV